MRTIRRSLAALEKALDTLGTLVLDARRAEPGRRKLRLSPRRRAVLKLQGTYMGYLRHLPRSAQQQVKAMKAKRGFPAAIALARRLKG